jgi:hypothetical protein
MLCRIIRAFLIEEQKIVVKVLKAQQGAKKGKGKRQAAAAAKAKAKAASAAKTKKSK